MFAMTTFILQICWDIIFFYCRDSVGKSNSVQRVQAEVIRYDCSSRIEKR